MKRLYILLLALPLTAGFIACDKEDPDTDEPNPATQHYEPKVDPGGQVVY